MFYCVQYNVLLCPVQCSILLLCIVEGSIVYSTMFYCVQYNVLCVQYNVLLCPVQCSIVYSTGFYCVPYRVLLCPVQCSIVSSTMLYCVQYNVLLCTVQCSGGPSTSCTSPASCSSPLCTRSFTILHQVRSHRKIRLIESNAKCRYLKKLLCKGTLWQVFICLRPPPLLGFCFGL